MNLANLRVDCGYILVKPDKNPVEQNGVDVVKSHNGRRQLFTRAGGFFEGLCTAAD
jgi:hypothetical protein